MPDQYHALLDKAALRKRPRPPGIDPIEPPDVRPFTYLTTTVPIATVQETGPVLNLSECPSSPVLPSTLSQADLSEVIMRLSREVDGLKRVIQTQADQIQQQAEKQAEQETKQTAQASEIQILKQTQESESAKVRQLEMAIVLQCFTWSASSFITEEEVSNITYEEFRSHSNYCLGDMCLFLSDQPVKKQLQVSTMWTVMRRMLNRHLDDIVNVKIRQSISPISGEKLLQHFDQIEDPKVRRELISDRLKKIRSQVKADFLDLLHAFPITVDDSELSEFFLITRPLNLCLDAKISLRTMLKAFYIILRLDKETASPSSSSSSFSSPPPCYSLSDKPTGIVVYHLLCLTIDHCQLGPSIFVNYDNWRVFMIVFRNLCRSLPSLRCSILQDILHSNRFQRFI